MVRAARLEALALALPGAYATPHFDRVAFRTRRRIFATLPPDGQTANLMLDPHVQAAVCEALPHAFSPVPGGWGAMGATTVDLAAVSESELASVLGEAHARACAPPKRRKR